MAIYSLSIVNVLFFLGSLSMKDIAFLRAEICKAGININQVLDLLGIQAVKGEKINIQGSIWDVSPYRMTDLGNCDRFYNIYDIMEYIGGYKYPENIKEIYKRFIGAIDEPIDDCFEFANERNLAPLKISPLDRVCQLFIPIENSDNTLYQEYFDNRGIPDAFKILKRCGVDVGFNKDDPSIVILKWNDFLFDVFSIKQKNRGVQYGTGVSFVELGANPSFVYVFESWCDAMSYLQYQINQSKQTNSPCRPGDLLILHGLKFRMGIKALSGRDISNVFFCLDNDEAGAKVAVKFATQLKEQGINSTNLIYWFKKHQVKNFSEYLVKMRAKTC